MIRSLVFAAELSDKVILRMFGIGVIVYSDRLRLLLIAGRFSRVRLVPTIGSGVVMIGMNELVTEYCRPNATHRIPVLARLLQRIPRGILNYSVASRTGRTVRLEQCIVALDASGLAAADIGSLINRKFPNGCRVCPTIDVVQRISAGRRVMQR